MLLYSICYYYGKNKISNLINHFNSFLKINTKEKQFILVNMVDSHDINYINDVESNLSNFIKNYNTDINFKILSSFNWGGTILGLWLTYNYSKLYDSTTYVAHFEEDFGPYNDKWLEDSISLLSDEIIYVGENTNGVLKSNDDDGRLSGRVYANSIRLGNPEVWTDGGYYFSTIEKLRLIDNKIGIFHKGNSNTKYTNKTDGIDYGEVGFPTLLYHNKFKFTSLHRDKYFINEW
jgi:hypothetical protein